MVEARTAQERLAQLRRAQRRVHRERMVRAAAGPLWERVRGVVPAVFPLAGVLHVRRLLAPAEEVVAALRADAVFALDTAMRLRCGAGCIAGGDVHAYLPDSGPLERLAAGSVVGDREEPDRVLVRPWPGAPRLFAVVADPPPHERLDDGTRVVTADRLIREILGALGPRLDVLAPLLVSAP